MRGTKMHGVFGRMVNFRGTGVKWLVIGGARTGCPLC